MRHQERHHIVELLGSDADCFEANSQNQLDGPIADHDGHATTDF